MGDEQVQCSCRAPVLCAGQSHQLNHVCVAASFLACSASNLRPMASGCVASMSRWWQRSRSGLLSGTRLPSGRRLRWLLASRWGERQAALASTHLVCAMGASAVLCLGYLLCQSSLLAAPYHAPLQELESQEARLQRRTEELAAVERRIAAAQQRLDGETERLKRAVAAVEEEGAALKVRCKRGGRSCSVQVADCCPAWLTG